MKRYLLTLVLFTVFLTINAKKGNYTGVNTIKPFYFSNTTDNSLFIPNILTPNGDGLNDIFVTESENISALHTQIYNRWGMLLFESHQIKEGWDGRTRAGVEVTEGTYFYIITADFNGNTEIYKGTITLLR